MNRDFIKAFMAQSGGLPPTFGAVGTYDAFTAMYKVLEAQKGQIDPDKTMELVKTLKFESPRGPIAIDPETRDIVQNVYIRRTELKGGKLVNTEIDTYPMVKDPSEHPMIGNLLYIVFSGRRLRRAAVSDVGRPRR